MGKILTERGRGRLVVCSGAIVDSPSGSVVSTAAHCVNSPDSPGLPARGWFAPGYEHDGTAAAMASGWRIESYHTPPGWDVSRRLEKILPHDYAFVAVERKGGRTIQETYGAHALAFEPIDDSRRVALFGYPAAPPYDGESMGSCEGRAELLTEGSAHEANAGGLLLEPCELTEGASGGPWLQGGTVVGVISVGSGDGQVLGRPYPAGAGRALLERAGGS
jgi:Trypsin-like peptidase domain